MKKLILFISCLILTSSIFSQKKGDNKIIIENFKSFSTIKRTLIIEGYELKNYSEEEEYFTTEFHPIEGSVYANNLKVKIKGYMLDSNLILTAEYTSEYSNVTGGQTQASGKATYFNRKLISKRLSFDELTRIAKKLSNEFKYGQDS